MRTGNSGFIVNISNTQFLGVFNEAILFSQQHYYALSVSLVAIGRGRWA